MALNYRFASAPLIFLIIKLPAMVIFTLKAVKTTLLVWKSCVPSLAIDDMSAYSGWKIYIMLRSH